MYNIQKLPLNKDFLDKEIIKKTILANRALAELNWVAEKIPNQNILINSLSLQEAKDSSEVENIITTHDELYKAQVDNSFTTKEAKEVENYREALLYWFKKKMMQVLELKVEQNLKIKKQKKQFIYLLKIQKK